MAKRAKTTPTGTTQSVQSAKPAEWAAPQIQGFINQAQSAYDATPKNAFAGPLVAQPNQDQRAAVDAARGFAASAGMGAPQLQDLAMRTIAGDFLRPESNPYLAGSVASAMRPVQESLNQNIVGIGDAFGDAYGGARQGVAQGRAIGDATGRMAEVANSIYDNNYQRERQNQLNSPALLEAARTIGMAPAQILQQVGNVQQGWEQSNLDADLRRYEMQLAAPWQGMPQYQSALGIAQPYGTQTVNTSGTMPRQGGGLGGALQGGLGGAATGFQMGGPWGGLIGGGVGTLASLFG